MEIAKKTPWHLWVVGIVTLLWNAIGAYGYTMTRLDRLEALDMTPEQITYFDGFPVWANAFWALGVWGAVAGSLLILLRSRWAVPVIAVSIVGLVGTTLYQRVIAGIPDSLDNPVLSVLIWATTLFMLWYAYRMRSQGVLR